MAIYHCSVKTIGRSGGSSSVNSAAYRSGEKLFDESLGKTFFYSGKSQDVMHKEIIAPSNAPEWVFDREKLWNAVESVEGRKDSQLAREIEISLPREFTTDQNIALVREYVQEQFVDRGMVADVCLHYGRKGESYNPHAHVMLTMRSIDENGFGKKDVSWNDRGLLNEWRESWADLSNKHLALNGFEKQIDHRSLADQGIELVPQNVELPSDAKERLTEQRDRQVSIMRENGEKLKENPEIAFRGITNQQSVFTEKDIARYLNSRTANKQQFDEVFNALKNHEDLVRLADKGGEYLYTTKEILDIERSLFKDARSMSESSGFSVKDKDLAGLDNKDLSTEQKAAVEYICQDKGLRAIVGYAGTGKTHMLSSAKEIWENSGYNVHGATLSGIAAQGLERGSGIESKTVARRLIDWENGRGRLSSKDVLVIDEAGMLGIRGVSRIMKEASGAGAKVVMLGDPQQLQAIEAGAAFRGVVEREGCLEMSDVKRQEVSWQREATKDFAMGKTGDALKVYNSANKLHQFDTKEKAMHIMVKDWEEGRVNRVNRGPDRGVEDTSIMLAFRRSDVAELNAMARGVLKEKGDLDSGISVETLNGAREFSKSDQVYFLRNDNGLNVKNGTLGTVKSINDQGDMVVNVKEAACDREVSFNVKDYGHIDHGYAATVHKAQGVTGDKSYVLATRGFNQHLSYVSMSRHVQDVNMYWSKDEFKDFKSLERHLSREATKENALDYVKVAKDFAETRGLGDTYKDIALKCNKVFSEVKDKIKDIGKSVKENFNGTQILANIEERMLFRKEMRKIGKILDCPVSRGVEAGEELRYAGTHKIGKEDYAVMCTGGEKVAKIMPYENCYNIKQHDQVDIVQHSRGDLIAQPTSATLWKREINNISKEYGKPVSVEMEVGDTGRCRGTIDHGKSTYYVIEQYDKVSLLSSDKCESRLKDGDYMKVQETQTIDYFGDRSGTKVEACRDEEKHKQIEQKATKAKEMQMEKSKGREMDFSM